MKFKAQHCERLADRLPFTPYPWPLSLTLPLIKKKSSLILSKKDYILFSLLNLLEVTRLKFLRKKD